jgi:hypothetical protein
MPILNIARIIVKAYLVVAATELGIAVTKKVAVVTVDAYQEAAEELKLKRELKALQKQADFDQSIAAANERNDVREAAAA